MEKEILQYLVDKFSPRVIVLGGSRVTGENTDKSDWDVFLFCEHNQRGGFYEWNGHTLDLTVHTWPKPNDWVFTIPSGPLWPVKVLLDDTKGEFDKILERTKAVHGLGPLWAYPDGCAERLQKLDRWLSKIEKYKDTPEIQFYYTCCMYEFLIRVWFEQQNLWPQPAIQAFNYIKRVDPDFWDSLSQLPNLKGDASVELCRGMIDKLKLLKQKE